MIYKLILLGKAEVWPSINALRKLNKRPEWKPLQSYINVIYPFVHVSDDNFFNIDQELQSNFKLCKGTTKNRRSWRHVGANRNGEANQRIADILSINCLSAIPILFQRSKEGKWRPSQKKTEAVTKSEIFAFA